MTHDAHRSDRGREDLLSFTVPREGDRVRVWYVSNWSQSDQVQEVRGTVAGEARDESWYTAVAFEDADGFGYRLTHRDRESWVLRRETYRDGQYRRLSARFGGVVAVATGPGPRLPASPFASWEPEADAESGAEPALTPATFAPDAEGQATLADYQRPAGAVEDADAIPEPEAAACVLLTPAD